MERWARFAPVTGIVFAGLLTASFVTSGSTPNSDATGAAVITYFKANKTSQNVSAILGAVAVVFFAFFAATLWNRLRARLTPSALPAAGLVGAAMIAVGAAAFSSLTFCLTDVTDKLDPSAAQAPNVLNNDFFLPLVIGISIFLIANGLAIATGGVLPRWLGWIAIVIGVVAPTPLAIVSLVGSGLWVLAVSIFLLTRSVPPTPAESPTAA